MREINKIIIHCSATEEGKNYTITQIDSWHKQRGFKKIGYHYVVYLDGTYHRGRQDAEVGAHCTGYNKDSIGICYIGGLDKNGKSKDTRTEAQKKTIITLIRTLKSRYPSIKEVIGHRDTSPDLNKNGVIEPKEYIKDCPCFNAKEEYKNI